MQSQVIPVSAQLMQVVHGNTASLTDLESLRETSVAVFSRRGQSVESMDEKHDLKTAGQTGIEREKYSPYPHEALEAIDQPRQLNSFFKRAIEHFRANCPAGFGLATYVS
jgi:hypothetical protein